MKKDIIILAAGIGSRLRPLTDTVPKTMVEVNGEAIIKRLLKQIDSVEATDLNLNIASGYKGEVLKDFVEGLGLNTPINYVENVDFNTTNNMYSLNLVFKTLTEKNDIVIINADCFYEDSIVKEMVLSQGNYIAVDKSNFSEESMKVTTVENGRRVRGMSKTLEQSDHNFVSMDIYAFTGDYKEKIEKITSSIIENGELNSWTEVAIDVLSKQEQSNISTLDATGRKWMEIDNHADLKKAEEIFK